MSSQQEAALNDYVELVQFLAESLLDDDVAVEVEGKAERDQLRLELHVPEEQRGRVIGRGGRIARAMRVLASSSGIPNHQPVVIDIVD